LKKICCLIKIIDDNKEMFNFDILKKKYENLINDRNNDQIKNLLLLLMSFGDYYGRYKSFIDENMNYFNDVDKKD
jgi:hypothetical protein